MSFQFPILYNFFERKCCFHGSELLILLDKLNFHVLPKWTAQSSDEELKTNLDRTNHNRIFTTMKLVMHWPSVTLEGTFAFSLLRQIVHAYLLRQWMMSTSLLGVDFALPLNTYYLAIYDIFWLSKFTNLIPQFDTLLAFCSSVVFHLFILLGGYSE